MQSITQSPKRLFFAKKLRAGSKIQMMENGHYFCAAGQLVQWLLLATTFEMSIMYCY